jgi:hypothetical protein
MSVFIWLLTALATVLNVAKEIVVEKEAGIKVIDI